MKVRVEDIKDKTLVFEAVEPVDDYAMLTAMQNAAECEFLSPLSLQLTVAREYDHIRVHGRVETKVHLSCSRCLAGYDLDIVSPFRIFYTPAAGLAQDEEVELSEEDLISVTYEGDEIDFSTEIAEQVAMAIPFKPLCREDCKGLCSSCGADLNTAECGCNRTDVNVKMSALKNFKINQ